MSNLIIIDGRTDLPDPAYKGITWAIQDVDYDAGRAADGMMQRNRVAQKRKLTVTWPPLPPSEVRKVLQSMTKQEFSVTAYDFLDGANRTMTAYVGDRTIPYLSEELNLCDSFSVGLVEF